MSKWKQYSERAGRAAGGMFVRLKSGEAVRFVVVGDPHERHLIFPEGGGKPEDVSPGTPGATVQIGLEVYDTDKLSLRILQLTPNTFAGLADKLAEFGDERVYRIKRTGEGLKTRYAVDHVGPATDEQVEHLSQQDRLDLEQYGWTPIEIAEDPAPVAAAPAGKKGAGARTAPASQPQAAQPQPNDDNIPF